METVVPGKDDDREGSAENTEGPLGVYTLLAGSALECVEHLKLEEMLAENGEDKLWEVLHGRFLKRNRQSLGEVFGRAAKDGESTTEWVASVKDVCDRGLGPAFRPKQGVGLPCTAVGCQKNRKQLSKPSLKENWSMTPLQQP